MKNLNNSESYNERICLHNTVWYLFDLLLWRGAATNNTNTLIEINKDYIICGIISLFIELLCLILIPKKYSRQAALNENFTWTTSLIETPVLKVKSLKSDSDSV